MSGRIFRADERAQVAAQVASLRRAGWTASQSVTLVADSLPEGADRADLLQLAGALSRGERHGHADPLLRLLGRGDAASAEAVDAIARALRNQAAAEIESREAAVPTAVLGVGALLLCTLLGFAFSVDSFPVPEESLPRPTVFGVKFLSAMRFLGPLLALGLVFLLFRYAHKLTPGGRERRAAERLHLGAAELAAGIDRAPAEVFGSELTPLEVALARRWAERRPLGEAATRLAVELERVAAGKMVLFRRWAPIVGVIALAILLTPVLGSLMLPIFSIAGSIR